MRKTKGNRWFSAWDYDVPQFVHYRAKALREAKRIRNRIDRRERKKVTENEKNHLTED